MIRFTDPVGKHVSQPSLFCRASKMLPKRSPYSAFWRRALLFASRWFRQLATLIRDCFAFSTDVMTAGPWDAMRSWRPFGAWLGAAAACVAERRNESTEARHVGQMMIDCPRRFHAWFTSTSSQPGQRKRAPSPAASTAPRSRTK